MNIGIGAADVWDLDSVGKVNLKQTHRPLKYLNGVKMGNFLCSFHVPYIHIVPNIPKKSSA